MSGQKTVLRAVVERRRFQDEKWGVQRHPDAKWFLILGEELGEVAEAMLENNVLGVKHELEDVAAVAIAQLEQIHAERFHNPGPWVAYLAGPIADCSDEEAHGWRDEFTALYPHVLNPMARDYRGREVTAQDVRDIVEGDKADIDRADVVVVWYVRPSVGTSMEVLYAWETGKPVIVVNPGRGPISPWLTYHAAAVVPSLGNAAFAVSALCADAARSPANLETKKS